MKNFYAPLIIASLLFSFPVLAEECGHKPDDSVSFTLSAEDWVTTKSARVIVEVEASVSNKNAGSMRAEMMKGVNDLAKTDWRLTSFNRSMDQTGLERWSATFESRLEENLLSGLTENAKKISHAGLQLSISDIDFSPTLDETESTKALVRSKIFKQASDQTNSLNSSLPNRNYRIASISFIPSVGFAEEPMLPRRGIMMKASSMMAPAPAPTPAERSEKITLTAEVSLAAAPSLTK